CTIDACNEGRRVTQRRADILGYAGAHCGTEMSSMRWLVWAAGLVSGLGYLAGCAGQQCDFHSQCGSKHYCERGHCMQDCRQDFDCAAGQVCNEIGQCVAATDAGP